MYFQWSTFSNWMFVSSQATTYWLLKIVLYKILWGHVVVLAGLCISEIFKDIFKLLMWIGVLFFALNHEAIDYRCAPSKSLAKNGI
ncbi:hypothetical protein CLV98_102518 [Dyadobacter jejuensis]|uniref:Uncharacterized protein n=2 Tax=Dyadobacter jejuensis TaxID=1082580 RepID=A0A316APN7_9BACT|nr:hypothetical protein CLV98_102518 [Dyadobacter jejuensis]